MFFSVNKLNEGKGKSGFSDVKNGELAEGKNPKVNDVTCAQNWPQKNYNCHTNRNWEKLRK